MSKNEPKIQIIPLGGLGEIGKNMTVIQYEKEILVIDAGLMFPEEDMPGIDIVIPDITYLKENRENVKAILLTHGHEDHIGALPYVLQELNVPLFGTKLTLGLVEGKLKENKIKKNVSMNVVNPLQTVKIGNFTVDFFRVNHSIPDSLGIAIHTPVGTICHTGDFKFDQTPVDGKIADLHKLAELGSKGVLVLLSDSTNAERTGYTMSEKVVGATIEEIFGMAKGRIIVATFASNIHRIQQVVDAAFKYDRKVAIVGRSMVNTVSIAESLGYINLPENMILELDEISHLPENKIVIITTGSQGEPMSALTRMAMSEHKKLEILPGDTVLIAATPIPGNEKLVARTIDHLFKQGADVIYEKISGVHVSGHASQEELKLMINLVRPRYFIPVHGEFRHLIHHANLAKEVGIPEENIFIAENGRIIEFSKDGARFSGKVTAGKVLVDGLGVGDVGNIVLRDRKQLAQDGIMIVVVTIDKESTEVVAGPDIISRGFVYVRESEQLIEQAKDIVKQELKKCQEENITEWSSIKSEVREALGKFLFEQTRRRPMILPIIMEV
ncbi:ribonuclease J [Thermovenabulum gondwanense]|uniref:Ribonuclease J n=1 Tax=Thermovenabulum gondwanense TaxID=520767 RepID=A0A162MFS8_9FIRM|nr:ribonuclease J [Thermovenabulum gondwanense]KYO65756.1 Ribonuclease J1 [Thermovenabulum gondwanense]